MTTGLDMLTDKEKDTLRLLLRGHDAKSSAQALGLSVHTVNERLRDARRKLGVTSSREAARRLLAEEGDEAPEMVADKELGDARQATGTAEAHASASQRRAGPGLAPILAGVLVMSLILAALLIPASPISVLPFANAGRTSTAESSAAAAETTAADFLELLDQSRWAESYAATGKTFRTLNTLERWSEVSATVRPPLGKMLARVAIANEYVPAPPEGYRLIKFRSTYASGAPQIESVSLAWEDGAWKVAGIAIEADVSAARSGGASLDLDQLQQTARAWLVHIDKGDWQASYAASGSAFRDAISSPAWAQAAAQARQPLGSVTGRELLEYQSLSAPREQRIVIFTTDFANRAAATETVTLERDGADYRVVGYWIK